jgi:hypothetical protein
MLCLECGELNTVKIVGTVNLYHTGIGDLTSEAKAYLNNIKNQTLPQRKDSAIYGNISCLF